MNTCMPACMAAMAASAWVAGGVTTNTPSRSSSSMSS